MPLSSAQKGAVISFASVTGVTDKAAQRVSGIGSLPSFGVSFCFCVLYFVFFLQFACRHCFSFSTPSFHLCPTPSHSPYLQYVHVVRCAGYHDANDGLRCCDVVPEELQLEA